jgi:hypothetical protein
LSDRSPYYGPAARYRVDGSPRRRAIAASTDSTVVFAGSNACSWPVRRDHSADGIETRALSSSRCRANGSQGEQIGVIGATGYSTGRHLHFEVIDNGVRQNPLDYLP